MRFTKVMELLNSEGPILSLLSDAGGDLYLEMRLDANYGVIAFKTDRASVIDFMQNIIPFERLLQRSAEDRIYTRSGKWYIPVAKREIEHIPLEYGGFRYTDFHRSTRNQPSTVYRQLAGI